MLRQISKELLRPRAIARPAVCVECRTRFFGKRKTAKFCSNLCRQRAFQTKHNPQPEDRSALIVGVLHKLGWIGQVAPIYKRDPTSPTFALLVPRSIAADEINVLWTVSPATAVEVAEALKSQGILDHRQPLPKGANAKVLSRLPRFEIRNANSPKTSTKSVHRTQPKGPKSAVEPFWGKVRRDRRRTGNSKTARPDVRCSSPLAEHDLDSAARTRQSVSRSSSPSFGCRSRRPGAGDAQVAAPAQRGGLTWPINSRLRNTPAGPCLASCS